MASAQELSDFLSSVEQRAFKQTVYAVRDDDAALDIVQDAMIKLTEKYGDRPAAELPLVFTRILQNRIHDWFRRQKVRNTWVTLFSNMGKRVKKAMILTLWSPYQLRMTAKYTKMVLKNLKKISFYKLWSQKYLNYLYVNKKPSSCVVGMS